MTRAGRSTPQHLGEGRHTRPVLADAPAAPRHKAPRPRRALRVAGPAVLALSLVGTVAVAQQGEDPVDDAVPTPMAVVPVDLSLRTAEVSRSATRRAGMPLATAKRITLQPTAVDHEFAAAPLNVWTEPGGGTEALRVLPRGARLAVTGQTSGRWAEVLLSREVPAGRGERGSRTVSVVRWVNAEFLAEREPAPPEPEPAPTPAPEAAPEPTAEEAPTESAPTSSGISGDYCPDGSAIESGLTSSAVRVYRAVCAAFPALSSYGGYDPHGEHVDGRAIDFMVTDSALGQAVADYLLANAGTLGVRDIIWAQRIWTPERSSEGWRFMPSRGSATADHYDHVHVAVY